MVDGKEGCELGCLIGDATGGERGMEVEVGPGQTQHVSHTEFWDIVRSEVSRIFSFNPVQYARELGLRLHVKGLGDSKDTRLWYEGRKKDNAGSFSVFVVDHAGNMFVNPFTTPWKVSFHAIGGNNVALRPEDLTGLRETPLVDGIAEVDMTDVVFKQVTSKCGDHCRIVARLSAPTELVGVVDDWVSDHIKVISGRCKNSRKRCWEELSPDDGVQQVKSVGDVLANRFIAAGLGCVRSIAAIDLGPGDRHPPEELLKVLQDNNTNSPFTAAKLTELVKNSRQVVAKESGTARSPDCSSSTTQKELPSNPNKRIRCEYEMLPQEALSKNITQAANATPEWTTFVDLSILDVNGSDFMTFTKDDDED